MHNTQVVGAAEEESNEETDLQVLALALSLDHSPDVPLDKKSSALRSNTFQGVHMR